MDILGEPSDRDERSVEREQGSEDPGDALATFREQWLRELENIPQNEDAGKVDKKVEAAAIEAKARNYFLIGVEYEQKKQMCEAIKYYKKAQYLVPDIEFRLYESTRPKAREITESTEENNVFQKKTKKTSFCDMEKEENNTDQTEDLYVRLSRVLAGERCVCQPLYQQTETHISSLPMEMILYILRWVVSPDLDMESLERCSSVCRGFFVAARDPEVWRSACDRVWDGVRRNPAPHHSSWRTMFLNRPRLRFSGCYINRNTYIRPGENNFQDSTYCAFHLVEYFRYIRFFGSKRVLMMTSADDHQQCINSLKDRNPKNPAILIGQYKLNRNHVSLKLKRQETKATRRFSVKKRRQTVVHDSGEQTYNIELEIKENTENRILDWVSYHVFTKYKNGMVNVASIDISNRTSPFKYSRVDSYLKESEAPLK